MGSCLVFEAGRGTGISKENIGCVMLGSAMAWPCYWSSYIVAGYRFIHGTMNDCRNKQIILNELETIQSIVENDCLPDRDIFDIEKIIAWRPPTSAFLSERLPTLKAVNLQILVDFHKKFFGGITGPRKRPAKFSNAFLCRMAKVFTCLDVYLAREEEDLHDTPFENSAYALADDTLDCLRGYCEMATKDQKITAQIYN